MADNEVRYVGHANNIIPEYMVGDVREQLRRLAADLDRYDYTATTIDANVAKRLYKVLHHGQWLVPQVEAWCVGYTYDPSKSFRPGEYAAFYGCITEAQAVALLEVFKRKHDDMYKRRGYPSGNTCEVKRMPIRVWSMIKPGANPEDVCRTVFDS